MRYSHPERAAEHGHYCVWHPTFAYDMSNNARQGKADGKSSGKSSVVKQEQVEEVEGGEEERWEVEEGEQGWWEYQDLGNGMQWMEHHANSESQPEIWEPQGQSSSSSSGAVAWAPAAKPAKKKPNHGRQAAKSPPLLH